MQARDAVLAAPRGVCVCVEEVNTRFPHRDT